MLSKKSQKFHRAEIFLKRINQIMKKIFKAVVTALITLITGNIIKHQNKIEIVT